MENQTNLLSLKGYFDTFDPYQIISNFLPNETNYSTIIPFFCYPYPPFIFGSPDQNQVARVYGPLYAILKELAIKANAG
jgi:hypothetical protein